MPKHSRSRGFTLLELMVVIAILGLLVAIVVPNIDRILAESRINAAKAEMKVLGEAVQNFRLSKRRLPASLEVLTEPDKTGFPFIDHIPADPWGQAYDYTVLDRRRYEIRCAGVDGEPGTEDDLIHPIVIDDER